MLKVKLSCICTIPGWKEESSLFTHYGRCTLCGGKEEVIRYVDLEEYKGNFKKIDWNKAELDSSDIYAHIKCQCGDYVFFTEGNGMQACSCGRVYKFLTRYSVDETNIGKPEVLIKQYDKERKAHYEKWGYKDETKILGIAEKDDI